MPSNYTTAGTLIDNSLIRRDLFAQGGLWNWGFNSTWGQLGDGTFNNASSPVQTVSSGTNWKQMSMGDNLTGGIKTDGTLWMWGQNTYGALGTNSVTDFNSPVQTVASGTNWKQMSCLYRTVAAIKTDGTLWLWGQNGFGQLGDNSITQNRSPIQTVAGGLNWSTVSVGAIHTAATKTDGTLWTWGSNSSGRLGNNTQTDASSPIQTVSGGTNWKLVSAGGYHTIAVKTDGTLWTWGSNTYGQLGDNTRTATSSPIQTISSGTNWKYVSASWFHSTAIKTDGTLWLWGLGSSGQLGDNTTAGKSSPVQTVAGGTNWKFIAAGRYHNASLKTDGTLWTWGQGSNGQLGNNATSNRSSPVQTIASGTNWTGIAAGNAHSGGITDIF